MDLSWIEAGAPLVTLASVGAAAWAFRHATGEADACQSLDDEVQRLREENRRLAEQLPEGQRLQELGEAIRTREASLERLQERLVQAQAATSRLEELQAACATREQALAEFQGRAAQLEPRVAELEGVFQEALEAQQTLEAARAQAESLRREAQTLQARRDQLQREVDQTEPLRAQLAHVKAELGEAREQLQGATRERDMARGLRAEHKQEAATFYRDVQAARAEREALQSELEGLRRARRSEEVALDELSARLSELQRRYEELDADARASEVAKAGAEAAVKVLQAEHQRLGTSGGKSGAEARSELWSPVLPAWERPASGKEEVDRLEGLGRYLSGLGLTFSQRTLYAFHTALKVQDVSPLAVLAGISGTGKSELPRRYAEAMGLHFLNVPVQPRWDSPQDLMGFFNYLEGRFRPTELTRALLQMDPFGAEAGRGWSTPDGWDGARSDDMLLVLLDEMNLARVEYYFSDLLSKLETRRGVDPQDRAARRAAELTLEVGQGASAFLRLFVGSNVLFVGTMNEDESTLALSDKVMDRANVLRFGKPRRLHERGASGAPPAPGAPLSRTTWESWRRGDLAVQDPDASEIVDDWIETLNAIMARVGRPFAHRTHQAIRAYVSNYPPSAGSHERAVADQIEQKILPKLRGLNNGEEEVSRALNELSNLTGDLGDEALKAAVEQGRQGHLFHWGGLEREVEA